MQKEQSKKSIKRIMLWIAIVLVVLIAAFAIYLSFSHGGDAAAQAAITDPSANVSVERDDHTITFIPDGDIKAGVVFYPGAKIHADAYAQLADALAAEGYLCILVNMPANMALVDDEAALPLMQEWTQVKDWYIGGHSMGSLAAEQCAHRYPEKFKGYINLASRNRNDFSDYDLPVLAVYASNDRICSPERRAEVTIPKPKNYTEVNIDGGCHAYFGSYGTQSADGIPTITRDDQQKQTLDAILAFIEEQSN